MEQKVAGSMIFLDRNANETLKRGLESICISAFDSLGIVVGDGASEDGSIFFTLSRHGRAATREQMAALKDLRATLAKRKAIMETRVVSDTYIDSMLRRAFQGSIHFSSRSL